MANELVELTQIKITGGKITGGFKKMIAFGHILAIEAGAQNTALITLANGEKIHVKETYDELRSRFELNSANPKNTDTPLPERLPEAAE